MNDATENVTRFYDEFAPLYHLIYPDWDTSMERQARMLDSVIRDTWGDAVATILDVACGIGTQSLGLAGLGYEITASDISPAEIERAKTEARRRGLAITFSVADMREAFAHHSRQFDLVIACDNAVPHLLTDADILKAFKGFYECTRPGGGCLMSVRDYEKEDRSGQNVQFYGAREEEDARYFLFQAREFHGQTYDLAMYLVKDSGGPVCEARVFRTRYYAIGITRLMELMSEAGFSDVRRLDEKFFQPVITGTRPA